VHCFDPQVFVRRPGEYMSFRQGCSRGGVGKECLNFCRLRPDFQLLNSMQSRSLEELVLFADLHAVRRDRTSVSRDALCMEIGRHILRGECYVIHDSAEEPVACQLQKKEKPDCLIHLRDLFSELIAYSGVEEFTVYEFASITFYAL